MWKCKLYRLQTLRPESSFRIAPNWPYIGKVTMKFPNVINVILKFFWHCFVFLAKFSYWCIFHVNIFTGSGVATIFFYKGLTRNPDIGNSPVLVLPNIWKLGWVRYTKCGTNVSNGILLNAAKYQGYSFYRFWVNQSKSTARGAGM